jgi:lysyl-tRNA synthetase, class II
MSSDQFRDDRLEKLEQLKKLGLNPFAYNWERTHHAADLQEKFADLASGEEVDIEVSVAGRIMTRRVFGKLASFSSTKPKSAQAWQIIPMPSISSSS